MCTVPEEGTGSLAKIKCASTPISCSRAEDKVNARQEAHYSKDPLLQTEIFGDPFGSFRNNPKLKMYSI